MKRISVKLLSLCVASIVSSQSFASCQSKVSGSQWVPVLTFSCDQDYDLTKSDISFDISQGGINAIANPRKFH